MNFKIRGKSNRTLHYNQLCYWQSFNKVLVIALPKGLEHLAVVRH
jgi:hypothetical protein